MFPIQIRPDAAVQELVEHATHLARGAQALAEVGEIDVGQTPKDAVYSEDKLTLYRYRPQVEDPLAVPVLIVYALVNRPYMADLQPDRSLVRGLLAQGLDVYLIDWGYADGADRFLTLDDYINGYLDRCVEVICRRHALPAINLFGICQGGTFSLCYGAMHPERVRNLVTTVTPVDFHTPEDMLSKWARHLDIDLLVDTLGNVTGELLNWTYLSLKPFTLMGAKYLDLVDLIDHPKKLKNFLRMEKWIFDSPDLAGEAFREFAKRFYQDNALINGELVIGGRPVHLAKVEMPVLNIFARDDHLVPPPASKALGDAVGTSDYTELEFPGGHIGIYVSGRSHELIPPTVGDWLRARC